MVPPMTLLFEATSIAGPPAGLALTPFASVPMKELSIVLFPEFRRIRPLSDGSPFTMIPERASVGARFEHQSVRLGTVRLGGGRHCLEAGDRRGDPRLA